MSRAWTWLDDVEIDEADMDKRTPLLDALARQWSTLHDAEELRGFARQSDMEDGRDEVPDYDTAEEAESAQLMEREMSSLRARQHDAQLSAITDKMHEYCARMMRPYEHWNEDERYMQYMESDRY
jgi:hypothetical protein